MWCGNVVRKALHANISSNTLKITPPGATAHRGLLLLLPGNSDLTPNRALEP